MTVINNCCSRLLFTLSKAINFVPRRIALILGEKSGGLKPGSKPSTKSEKGVDKWGMGRNRNLCGAPERAFLVRDVCTRLLLPITLEEPFKWARPRKSNRGVENSAIFPQFFLQMHSISNIWYN